MLLLPPVVTPSLLAAEAREALLILMGDLDSMTPDPATASFARCDAEKLKGNDGFEEKEEKVKEPAARGGGGEDRGTKRSKCARASANTSSSPLARARASVEASVGTHEGERGFRHSRKSA